MFYYQKFRSHNQQPPPVLVPRTMPWKFPPAPPLKTQAATNLVEAIRNQYSWSHVVHRATFLLTTICLITAYFATGRFSLFWQDLLYELSAKGFPLTTPQFRAWSVLLGHLSWVGVGSALLFLFPFAPRFFRPAHPRERASWNSEQLSKKPWHWFRFQFRKPPNGQSVWVWWVLGGYCVSCWLFNLADWANHFLLPDAVLQLSNESVVSQLVAPEFNDRTASLIGYIAPCLSAPLWEELLYRGFLLPGLWSCLFRHNFSLAALVQAVVFSAHHMSLVAALPLAVLGYAWAVLYGLSGNLWTVCLVHALWNSRVFLTGWLGL
ncbi:hypothetical protein FisN_7Lh086 [Fistulifera solaris]|uniref:CAAX prenyl protease 2/Lysostaphin resistance protein A-like domain-containing protein n=1 Tax=Fistulifera solaris TaxID=1519565 RepID=A0A1Z5JCN6_FISSO|nr:hypothetical protein FisN_7Lh086 [Fistulifera solaris]|eukprot:GAX11716.1 hypothetical protein FisN_7Lh086 [Fistulifera solaris]